MKSLMKSNKPNIKIETKSEHFRSISNRETECPSPLSAMYTEEETRLLSQTETAQSTRFMSPADDLSCSSDNMSKRSIAHASVDEMTAEFEELTAWGKKNTNLSVPADNDASPALSERNIPTSSPKTLANSQGGDAVDSKVVNSTEDSSSAKVSPPLLKANTCSSLFLKHSITVPNVRQMILGVALLIFEKIDQNMSFHCPKNKKRYIHPDPFSPKHYVPRKCPDVNTVYDFLLQCFELAQWSPECHILAAIYAVRLTVMSESTLKLHAQNWDRVLLTALLLAQKVWDDSCLGNVDFPVLYKESSAKGSNLELTAKEVALMEQVFLQSLHFEMHVTPGLYAQYYFELNALAEVEVGDISKDVNRVPLDEAMANWLSARTASYGSKLLSEMEREKALSCPYTVGVTHRGLSVANNSPTSSATDNAGGTGSRRPSKSRAVLA